MKILIVEDSARERRDLKTLLEMGGHKIIEATYRNEAFEFIQKDEFDLIITDLYMPKGNWEKDKLHARSGIEIVHEAKAFAKPGTRIWLTSADLTDEIRTEALRGGAEKVVDKGIPLFKALQTAGIIPS